MKSAYFRVIRFIPEERLLQIALDGLDDPKADIVYCEYEYDENHGGCRVFHGDKVYESPSYLPAVFTAWHDSGAYPAGTPAL